MIVTTSVTGQINDPSQYVCTVIFLSKHNSIYFCVELLGFLCDNYYTVHQNLLYILYAILSPYCDVSIYRTCVAQQNKTI